MKKIKHFNLAMAVFGICIFSIYCYQVWYMSWHVIPAENRDLFVQNVSTTKDLMWMIGMFLFGSTVGSRMNAETIATIAKGDKNKMQDESTSQ